jgi:hypothetical protein
MSKGKRKRKRRQPPAAVISVAQQPKPVDKWLGIGGIVATIILFLLNKTPTLVICLSTLIFVLLVHPVWNFWWVESTLSRRIIAIVLLASVCVGIGYLSWPNPKYLTLTEAQQEEFVRILHTAPSPRSKIRIRCAASEDVCASVSNFVGLFQKAGWIINRSEVERGYTTKPARGVTILAHGQGSIPDPDDPKWGLWVRVETDFKYLRDAFTAANISVSGPPRADSSLALGEIAVIFGPEP